MKLSGLAAVRYSSPIEQCLNALLDMSLPAAEAAGVVSALRGLSGASFKIASDRGCWVARVARAPAEKRWLHRHYRALKRKATATGPEGLAFGGPWMAHSWLEGEAITAIPTQEMAALLHRVHRGRLFGWRINLPAVLVRHWLDADPRRRSVEWLRQLKRLTRQREPHPLCIAPLHMDIHAGNLLITSQGLQLLDWEYAGDGDVALELACLESAVSDFPALLGRYARLMQLDVDALTAAVARWRPWVLLLMASWYECRWHQTGQTQFLNLAQAAWRPLRKR